MAAGDAQRALLALTGSGLFQVQADVVLVLCQQRQLTWRATALWATAPGEVSMPTVTVPDGGASGLWIVDTDAPGDPDATLTLHPSKPSDVWRRLLSLLPARASNEENA